MKLPREVKPIHPKDSNYSNYRYYQFNTLSTSIKNIYIDRVIEWMYKYAGEWFHWNPVPEYIREMIEILLFKDKVTLLEPRFHGKTNTMVCLFAYWMIELRKTVMVIVQSESHQINYFRMISSIFESDAVIEDYGNLIQHKSRKGYALTLIPPYQKGVGFPFFKASSILGGYVGLHFDWTHLDDIIQRVVRNDLTFRMFMEDFDGNVLDISPDKTTISGTRKEPGDFYDMAFDRGFLPLHRKSIEFLKGTFPTESDCIMEVVTYRNKVREQVQGFTKEYMASIEVKTLNCPNWTVDKILKRYMANDRSFYSQHQNEPVPPSGNIFKPHWLKVVKIEDYPVDFMYKIKLNIQNVVDPAFGKTYTSSDTAMIIAGMYEHQMVVVDIITGKFPNIELTEEIERIKIVHKIQKSWCEDDYAQISNRFDKTDKFFKLGVELYTNKGHGSKRDRVSNLDTAFKFAHIIFLDTCKHFDLFENQYLRFDASTEKGIDILDCLASAYRIIYDEDGEAWEEGTNLHLTA